MTSKFLIMSVQKLEVRTCDCFILAPLSPAMFIPGCSVATIPAAPYGQLWESCQPFLHFCTFDSSEHEAAEGIISIKHASRLSPIPVTGISGFSKESCDDKAAHSCPLQCCCPSLLLEAT